MLVESVHLLLLVVLVVVEHVLFFQFSQLLSFDPVIDMLDEIIYSWEVVFCMFFDVVMSCHFDEIWLKVFVDNVFVHLMCMTNVDQLVSHSMNYVYGTIKVLNSLDIWKLIKPKGPSKILESYSQDAHECSMEDNSTNIVLLSKIACRSTTNTSSKKYNILSGYTLLLCKISINRFNIIIQAFFSWYSSISFSEPSILIYYTININLLQEV